MLLLASPGIPQKVETDYDKSVDFARYKRYAWGANDLLTRQHPEDEAKIAKTLSESIDRQMQAKGYVLDEQSPDLRITYSAGGTMKTNVGVVSDMNRTYNTTTFSSNYPGGMPMNVWSATLANLTITATDAATDKPVWQAIVSKKISDTSKFMRDLNKEIDKVTAAALKKFPRQAGK